MTERSSEPRYRDSFQSYLAPGRLRYLARRHGRVVPEAPFDSICDLGCGSGLTALVFAAANPQALVIGVDSNPDQVSVATERAAKLRLKNIQFICAAIDSDTLASLPRFDLIAISGLFSWVAEDVRSAIYRFLARHARVGGLAYIHYMSSVGWASYAPIRALIAEVAKPAGSDDASREARVERVLVGLIDGGYLKQHAIARAKVKEFLREQPDMRLQHFLNPHFTPLPAETVHTRMTQSGFEFLCDCQASPSRKKTMTEQLPAASDRMPGEASTTLIEELTDFRLDRHDLFRMADGGAPHPPVPLGEAAEIDCVAIFPEFGDPLAIYHRKIASLDPEHRDLVDALLHMVGGGQIGLRHAVEALAPEFSTLDVGGACDMLIRAGILIPLTRSVADFSATRRRFATQPRSWLDEVCRVLLLDRRWRIFVSPAFSFGFRVGAEECAALCIADRVGLDPLDYAGCHALAETIAARHPDLDRATFANRVLDIVLFFAREKRQVLRLLGVTD